MEFEVVYDFAKEGFKLKGLSGLGLALAIIGAFIAFAPRLYRRLIKQSIPLYLLRGIGLLLLVGGSTWATVYLVEAYPSYRELREALESGRYNTVEGTVENFIPLPKLGDGNESFEVRGVRFEYSHFAAAQGYNKTASVGGAISSGLYVRIAYIGKTILRLEIKK